MLSLERRLSSLLRFFRDRSRVTLRVRQSLLCQEQR
jgi:hypothetical protein